MVYRKLPENTSSSVMVMHAVLPLPVFHMRPQVSYLIYFAIAAIADYLKDYLLKSTETS